MKVPKITAQQHTEEKEDPLSPKVEEPDSEEERKKREASWKTVKYGFTAIGVSLGLAGAYAIIELGILEVVIISKWSLMLWIMKFRHMLLFPPLILSRQYNLYLVITC